MDEVPNPRSLGLTDPWHGILSPRDRILTPGDIRPCVASMIANRTAFADGRPRRDGFLLLPHFPLMSYASAVEPLRAANHLAGRPLYAWRHIAVTGGVIQ